MVMVMVVVPPLTPLYGGEDVLRPDPALHGAVLVHVHLRALHLVDQAPQAPHQQFAALCLVRVHAYREVGVRERTRKATTGGARCGEPEEESIEFENKRGRLVYGSERQNVDRARGRTHY